MMLCPQEDPRRRPPARADRQAATSLSALEARAALESFYDDAATGDADMDAAVAQEAELRLSAIRLMHSAETAVNSGRVNSGIMLSMESQELRELADEFAHAIAWM